MFWSFWETITESGMAVLLFLTGGLLSVRLRLVQIRRFPSAMRALQNTKKNSDGGISAFSAMCTNLGATVGMGNVLGVSGAIAIGGPGSLLWMIIAAFFGMAIRYAENYLGVRYRGKRNGAAFGGPCAYIESGVPRFGKALAKLFSGACLLSGIVGMGSMMQASCIRSAWSPWTHDLPILEITIAVALTVLTGLVICGGAKKIAQTAERIVPFMTVGYILFCIWIIVRFRAQLPQTLLKIVQSAFDFHAAAGGAVGVFLQRTVLTGVQRGLFSNEAGLGLGAIAAAASDENMPQRAGETGILVTFLDTFVICTLSGLCVLLTQCAGDGAQFAEGWRRGLPWLGEFAPLCLSVFLTLFALTSIFGYLFYAENCLLYLTKNEGSLRHYRVAFLIAVFVGFFLPQNTLWRFAELTNAAMAIPNLIAILLLAKELRKT